MAASRTPAKKAAPRKRAPRRKKMTPTEVRLALRDQPLIGLTAAARLMGIAPPNVSRLRSQGRMPKGVEVEGSAMVYFRSEVEALGVELESERDGRS
jgi:predicted DNA-binding transcriptional regulator AlpA